MFSIEKCTVIPNSLLASYAENGYADSYYTELPGHISMEDYVFSFYTTTLFKLERFILTWTVLKPSNDLQAKELMDGKTLPQGTQTQATGGTKVSRRTQERILKMFPQITEEELERTTK
jgi:hypothetical protein